MSDNSLLERWPRSPMDSHLTLDVGVASGQIVLQMNARSPSPPINVRMTPNWHDYPIMTESLVRPQLTTANRL